MGTTDTSRPVMPGLVRTVAWAAAFLLASVAGRATLDAVGVPLFGPGVGVAFLWLASGDRTTWWRDCALMGLIAISVGIVDGSSVAFSVLALIQLIPAAAGVAVLRLTCPDVWGGGGRQPLSRLSQFGRFLGALAAACFFAALLRTTVGVAFLPDETWSLLPLRTGRALASLLALGTYGLLLAARIEEHRHGESPLIRLRGTQWLEVLLVVAAMAAVFWFGFVLSPDAPTTFVLALVVVWPSIRFTPLASSLFALVTGVGAVALTYAGHGPIANISSDEGRALIAQLFVIVMMVIAMVISLSRRQFFDTITRLRRSEIALAGRAQELDLMLENLGDGVAIIEEGGRFVHANSAIQTLLGGEVDPPGEPLRQMRPGYYSSLFHPDGRPLLDEELPYLRAMAGEHVVAEEFHLRHPSVPGGRVLAISSFPLPVEPGSPRRAMVTVRDITAESAHREALSNFAGTVAHDLNNPLTLVGGWAEALDEEFADAPAVPSEIGAPMVQHIRLAAERMRDFIADLLAHAVAQDQNLRCERVELLHVVKGIREIRTRPGSSGDEITTEWLPAVWADLALITQLFDNLVGNAFKYVAPGVTPHVTITADEPARGWASVRVSDNGIGIPPEHRLKVFESFHRAARRDGYRGTGLGLAICKRIVERHGGRISVTDNPDGQGSCFVFTLPTTPEAFAAATRP